jgi:hypothetical protein
VPTPTPDGVTARELYQKRVEWIDDGMQSSAQANGCRFHQAWYAQDGSAFYALAQWESIAGAEHFFEEWEVRDEPGEIMIRLMGHVGLVPLEEGPAEQ